MLSRTLLLSLALLPSVHADTFVALAGAYSPTNPADGETVIWNPGQPNEVANLTFGTDAFTTVQEAIDAAAEGDTVFIDEGDYIEGSTILVEKGLTLLGDNRETTRLLREENVAPHSIARIGRHTATFENLSISGGQSTEDRNTGGGINCNSSRLTVRNCLVTANVSTNQKSGGGIGGLGYHLTIIDSTVSGNTATGGTDNGGGIGGQNSTVIVENCIISNNSTNTGNSGGGIGGISLNITVRDSIIENNTNTGNSGGGIGGFRLTANLFDSIFRDNTVRGSGSGGGIAGTNSRITVNRCLLTDNQVQGGDSGGAMGGRTSRLTAVNSTLSRNTATSFRSGGAISGKALVSVTLQNCTITNNTSTNSSSAGGLFSPNPNLLIQASNTIIAGNTATQNDSNPEVSALIPSNGGNLIGIPDGLTINDILLPLADNGGPTETHALAENSPAINIGLNNALGDVTTDQRGDDFPRILNSIIDAGAVEADTSFILDPSDDSDGDGLKLIFELALGTEPNAPDFADPRLPSIGQSSLENTPVSLLAFGRGATPLPGTILVVEFSTTLTADSFEELYRFNFDTGVGSTNPRNDLVVSETAESFNVLLALREKAFFRVKTLLSE